MVLNKIRETAPIAQISDVPLDAAAPGPYGIPAMVDSIKIFDDFQMTRFMFFSIDAKRSIQDWVALLRSASIPFLLFGDTATIYRPLGGNDTFTFSQTTEIDELFDAIEEYEGVVVETEHIWLPNAIIGDLSKEDITAPSPDDIYWRGAVWRISYKLFQLALQFRRELISAEDFLTEHAKMADTSEAAYYTNRETTIFRRWSANQIDEAKENYQRQKDNPDIEVLEYEGDS